MKKLFVIISYILLATTTLIEDYDGDGDSDGFKYSDVFPSYVVGDVYQTIN